MTVNVRATDRERGGRGVEMSSRTSGRTQNGFQLRVDPSPGHFEEEKVLT